MGVPAVSAAGAPATSAPQDPTEPHIYRMGRKWYAEASLKPGETPEAALDRVQARYECFPEGVKPQAIRFGQNPAPVAVRIESFDPKFYHVIALIKNSASVMSGEASTADPTTPPPAPPTSTVDTTK